MSRWKSPWVAQETASPRDSFMQIASHPDIGFVVRRAGQRVRDVPQGRVCIPGNLSTCASSSATSSPGNLRRGQPNEEGKPNECGAGSDQKVEGKPNDVWCRLRSESRQDCCVLQRANSRFAGAHPSSLE